MHVITVSREFGSGGRELGKRLSDALGYAYYDREIEASVAERMNMDGRFISSSLERGMLVNIPLHFGRTLTDNYLLRQQMGIFVEKQKVLREIAGASDCVIVGRAADVILAEYKPFKIFVYADMAHKIKRCREYAEIGETLNAHELEREIRKIDGKRARYHRIYQDTEWGDKAQYHLCVDTTGVPVKALVPSIAEYISCWFRHRLEE